MKVFILGTGDAMSRFRFNTSFIVCNNLGFNLAVECPHPYFKVLEEAKMVAEDLQSEPPPELKDIDYFIFSHLHGDHINGLEDVLFYKKFLEGKVINLYAYYFDMRELWHHRLRCAMGTSYENGVHIFRDYDFYYNNIELIPDRIVDIPDDSCCFSLQTKRTKHHIPTSAMVIKNNSDGKSIAFSGDTEFDEELIEWMNQADIIIHECFPFKAPGHTSYDELMSLPSNIKEKLRLIHYPDSFNVESSEIECLFEGQVLEVVGNDVT